MNTAVRSRLNPGMASLGSRRAGNGRFPSSGSAPRSAVVSVPRAGSCSVQSTWPLVEVRSRNTWHHRNARVHRLPSLVASAKKKDELDLQAEREAALQRREAELWARQGDMYERALNELKEFKSMYGEERRGWMARELALMKENDALRSKLMYLVSRIGAVDRELVDADWVDGTAASGEIPDVVSSRDDEEMGKERDRQGTDQGRQPGRGGAPPESSIAADFAAAFAAVEQGDILKDDMFLAKGNAPTPPVADAEVAPGGDVEGQKQDLEEAPQDVPTGPPPNLTVGDDNIYWMNQLHVALVDEGYFPGDEDIEDFFFGPQTQSALLTFQACNGLEETGCTDDNTWKALLGDDLRHKKSRDLTEDMNPLTEKMREPELESSTDSSAPKAKPFAELFSAETYEVQRGNEKKETTTHVHDEKYFADGHVEITDETTVSRTSKPERATWPTVLEGEGGQVVHALHVLLSDAGYYPNDDELQLWQFGDSTVTAIKTFQACNGLAETGTVNERLWKMLAGADAKPSILDTLKSGKSDDEEL